MLHKVRRPGESAPHIRVGSAVIEEGLGRLPTDRRRFTENARCDERILCSGPVQNAEVPCYCRLPSGS